MAQCSSCDQDMLSALSCGPDGDGVDPSVIAADPDVRNCFDCGVAPGGVHHPGCDSERCTACGRQWISCGHSAHDPKRARWTGLRVGVAECRALGWFCRDLHLDGALPTKEWPRVIGVGNMRWHDPCGPDDEGAHEDLNRYFRHIQSGASA